MAVHTKNKWKQFEKTERKELKNCKDPTELMGVHRKDNKKIEKKKKINKMKKLGKNEKSLKFTITKIIVYLWGDTATMIEKKFQKTEKSKI